MFTGHDKAHSITSLYAPFSPDYLRRALAVIEGILKEVERPCLGAFRRSFARANNVVALSTEALSA